MGSVRSNKSCSWKSPFVLFYFFFLAVFWINFTLVSEKNLFWEVGWALFVCRIILLSQEMLRQVEKWRAGDVFELRKKRNVVGVPPSTNISGKSSTWWCFETWWIKTNDNLHVQGIPQRTEEEYYKSLHPGLSAWACFIWALENLGVLTVDQ